jgi:antitoxin PrlF
MVDRGGRESRSTKQGSCDPRYPNRSRPITCIDEILHFCNNVDVRSPVTINSRGVITLPARLRRALGLKPDDQLIAETTPEGLLLRPAVTLPVEIYTDERVREFDAAEAELASMLKPARKPSTTRNKRTARRKR